MKWRRYRWLLTLVALAAIGAASYVFLSERPLAVPVVAIERDVPVRVYGLGTVEARIVSRIGFEVGAALTALAVDSGDRVAEGQILARLHTAEQEARVARAEAVLAAAAATLGKAEARVVRARAVLAQRKTTNTRQQALALRKTISAQTAEEAQRDVDVAAADLAVDESEVKVAQALRTDAEAGALPERLDPCVLQGEDLDLFELVEEELLLALPIVAMHEDTSCQPRLVDAADAGGTQSPFRVLERLKPRR